MLGCAAEDESADAPPPAASRPARGYENAAAPAASSRFVSRSIWVDLPAPSPPSKVMKQPPSDSFDEAREGAAHQARAELQKAVEGPLPQRSVVDVVAGIERQVEGLHVAAGHPQPRHLGALLHRRAQADRYRRCAPRRARRSRAASGCERVSWPRAARPLVAAEHAAPRRRLAGGEELCATRRRGSPSRAACAIRSPDPAGLEAVDDDDQPLPVLHRRTDQAEAGLRRYCRSSRRRRRYPWRAAGCGSAGGSCSR